MNEKKRFGDVSQENINEAINESVPVKTRNTKNSIWKQFKAFCKEKHYSLEKDTTTDELANILTDWGYNMKKSNGEDYKEAVVKTMWNVTAKILRETYFEKYNRSFNPFIDLEFKNARNAKNANRKRLQAIPEKRKQSSVAIEKEHLNEMMQVWDEETPEGLQRKFYHVAAFELAWRGGEAVKCKIDHFRFEKKTDGSLTNRIEYNPIFSKTRQGGENKLSDSKWLTPNLEKPSICPVRLFKKLMSKRSNSIKTDRLFLTPNCTWNQENSSGWYKNMPVGENTLGKWTKEAAMKIGLDVENNKITNHSNRSSTVSNLAKSGISSERLIKITGHANTKSINPYLQLDKDHHSTLISNLRNPTSEITNNSVNNLKLVNHEEESKSNSIVYNNCVFHIDTMNMFDDKKH